MSQNTSIGIGLISHTNIGKTSLARTMLRKDVGEIRDEAHVTLESVGYTFLADEGREIILWDTPGFGGAVPANLIDRLKNQGSAINWLKRQVIDKFSNKPLYSSVEAAKTLVQRCDAALYLVNALDQPEDARYVQGELDLIRLLGIPVVLTINQVQDKGSLERKELVQRWRSHYGDHPAVQAVAVYDAFSRFWFEEIEVLNAVSACLPEAKRKPFNQLVEKHQIMQMELERRSSKRICELMAFATNQRLPKSSWPNGKKALGRMLEELQAEITAFVNNLAESYNLSARNSPSLAADLEHLDGLGKNLINESKTGLLTGAVSGASYGIAADIASGGLSFGGGALVGFVLGGFGGMLAAKGINAVLAGSDTYRWKLPFLKNLLKQLMVIYLLIAHHGRGKGGIDFSKESPYWLEVIEQVLKRHENHLEDMLKTKPMHRKECHGLLSTMLMEIFNQLFQDVEYR